MSAKDPFDLIRAELAKLEKRPGLAKTASSLRDQHRSKVHAAFCAGVDALLLDGWSRRAIAEHMDAHVTTLIGWYEHGDSKRDQLPAWALAALPAAARPALMRVMLDWRDDPPSRTGTDG